MSTPITEHSLFVINDGLANDEVSSDDELLSNFIENGVSESLAIAAIALRNKMLFDPFSKIVIDDGVLVVVNHERSYK